MLLFSSDGHTIAQLDYPHLYGFLASGQNFFLRQKQEEVVNGINQYIRYRSDIGLRTLDNLVFFTLFI